MGGETLVEVFGALEPYLRPLTVMLITFGVVSFALSMFRKA